MWPSKIYSKGFTFKKARANKAVSSGGADMSWWYEMKGWAM
jgi:hypothetical protein